MFTKSAELYDAIYRAKDYEGECTRLCGLIKEFARRPCSTLLDVACGTGGHLAYLRGHFTCEGLDADSRMLCIAKRRCPDVALHVGDMVDFDLERQFDVVTCLFSSIGYTKTRQGLNDAVQNMARHVHAGGLLIVEPWLDPTVAQDGYLDADLIDKPGQKICRMAVHRIKDGQSHITFDYLVATADGIKHFSEPHELGLFSREDYVSAFRAAYLEPFFVPEGLTGDRGLYIASA